MIIEEGYRVTDPDSIETPAMLVFRDLMEHNIASVCEVAGGGENLFCHVKTHKSEAVARRQIAHGIRGFKCATLKELEMVLQAGAQNAILAYPQVQERKIERLLGIAESYPDARIAALASSRLHIGRLAAAAARRRQSVGVMLDLDAGMHRTGIGFGSEAFNLYRNINDHEYLQAAGFHLYDGHEHFSDPVERESHANRHIESLDAFRKQAESAGIPVPFIVAGSSFSFSYYARAAGMHGSPGTVIYWDARFGQALPDMPYRWAAVVLTQVVDRFPENGLVTTDLGSKAISSDLPVQERAFLIGNESARLASQSEEHGVFRISGQLPEIGDYLLVVPGHICPTTIRYPGAHVVDDSGSVVDYFLHTARDRQ